MFYDAEHIGTASQSGMCYEFREFMVLRKDGIYYWASDSGCSCPTPFENHQFPADFESGNAIGALNALTAWSRGAPVDDDGLRAALMNARPDMKGTDMNHGEIVSFYVENDGEHVVLTVIIPGENNRYTVRTTQQDLQRIADAECFYNEGIPQAGTPRSPRPNGGKASAIRSPGESMTPHEAMRIVERAATGNDTDPPGRIAEAIERLWTLVLTGK